MALVPGAAEHARVVAIANRQQPLSKRLSRMERDASELRDELVSMKARNRAALIEKELAKLRGELPIAEVVPSAVVGSDCPPSDAPVEA